jgi:hypothetical protein
VNRALENVVATVCFVALFLFLACAIEGGRGCRVRCGDKVFEADAVRVRDGGAP